MTRILRRTPCSAAAKRTESHLRPGSPNAPQLKCKLSEMAGAAHRHSAVIGGQEVRTGKTAQAVMPHKHSHVLADWHKAGAKEVQQAIDAAVEARREWANWPWEERAAVFLRAAELLTTTGGRRSMPRRCSGSRRRRFRQRSMRRAS